MLNRERRSPSPVVTYDTTYNPPIRRAGLFATDIFSPGEASPFGSPEMKPSQPKRDPAIHGYRSPSPVPHVPRRHTSDDIHRERIREMRPQQMSPSPVMRVRPRNDVTNPRDLGTVGDLFGKEWAVPLPADRGLLPQRQRSTIADLYGFGSAPPR